MMAAEVLRTVQGTSIESDAACEVLPIRGDHDSCLPRQSQRGRGRRGLGMCPREAAGAQAS